MEIQRYERNGRRFDIILEEANGGGYTVEVVDVDAGQMPGDGWGEMRIYPTKSGAIFQGCQVAREIIEEEGGE